MGLEELREREKALIEKITEISNNYSYDSYEYLYNLYNELNAICNKIEEITGNYESISLERSLPLVLSLNARPKNHEIDEELLNSLSSKKDYYTEDEVKTLLNWTVNNTLSNLKKDMDTDDLTGACGFSQFSSLYPLSKLGLKITINNVNNISKNLGRHAFGTVIFPVLINGNIEEKQYLIDCTYSQFLHLSKSVENTYNIKKGRIPLPGYFINKDEKVKETIKELITNGYIEATKENLNDYMYGFFVREFPITELNFAKEKLSEIDILDIINNNQEEFDYTEDEFKDWGFNLEIENNYHK